jgi:lysophospholipase L1-like esterase
VFVHGYDYPVPDGRGYAGGSWILPGPWLEPGFRRKGRLALARNIEVMRTLIDRFNAMMRRVATTPGLEHVTYVDFRGLLSTTLPGKAYTKWWANELHPTEAGFEAIARRLHAALQKR